MSIRFVRKQWLKTVAMALLLCMLLLCLSGCSLFDGQKYDKAVTLFQNGNYEEAITAFSEIEQYEDSSTFIMYIKTLQLAESGGYALAASTFDTMSSFRDSKYLSVYYSARQAEEDQRYEDADAMYRTIVTFSDSSSRLNALPDLILQRDFASAASGLNDGSYDEEDQAAFADLATKQYSDSETRMKQDIYDLADGFLTDGNYGMAYALFYLLDEHTYSDSATRMKDCRFAYVQELMELGEYQEAYDHIQEYLLDYEPAADTLKVLPDLILKSNFDKDAASLYDDEYSESDATAFENYVTQVYSDSETRMLEEIYAHGDALLDIGEHEIALELFALLAEQEYSNSATRVQDCQFEYVKELMDSGDYAGAYAYIDLHLADYADATESRNECAYNLAEVSYANAQYADAYAYYKEAGEYSDAAEKASKFETDYAAAKTLLADGNYEAAYTVFSALKNYSDSEDQAISAYYLFADQLFINGEYERAYAIFVELGDYNDSTQRSEVVKVKLIEGHIANGRFNDALSLLDTLGESKEKTALSTECQYYWAIADYDNEDYKNAFYSFMLLGDYKESNGYVTRIVIDAAHDIYELGMSYYEWGCFDIARKCFEYIPEYKDVQTLLRYCNTMKAYQGVYKDPWLKADVAMYEVLVGNKLYHYDLKDGSYWSETVVCTEAKDGSLVLINEYDWKPNASYALKHASAILSVDEDGIKALGEFVDYDPVYWGKTTYFTREELDKKVLKKNYKEAEEVPEPCVGMTASEAHQSAWGAPKNIERTVYSWGIAERWTCNGKNYGKVLGSDRYIYLENGIIVGCED